MGHTDRKTTPVQVANAVGIEEGLVGKRRAELIAAKLTVPVKNQEDLRVTNHVNMVNKESVRRLTHLTQSRPAITHRPPSRRVRNKPAKSDLHFFAAHQESQKGEQTIAPHNDLLALIKKAVSDAKENYKRFYEGTHFRQPPGWFTWWRHGEWGQIKVKELCMTMMRAETLDLLLEQINLFFKDTETRYHNNSFAPFLLKELDKLLQNLSLSGCKLKDETLCGYNSWLEISVQLQQLLPKEEQRCINEPMMF